MDNQSSTNLKRSSEDQPLVDCAVTLKRIKEDHDSVEDTEFGDQQEIGRTPPSSEEDTSRLPSTSSVIASSSTISQMVEGICSSYIRSSCNDCSATVSRMRRVTDTWKKKVNNMLENSRHNRAELDEIKSRLNQPVRHFISQCNPEIIRNNAPKALDRSLSVESGHSGSSSIARVQSTPVLQHQAFRFEQPAHILPTITTTVNPFMTPQSVMLAVPNGLSHCRNVLLNQDPGFLAPSFVAQSPLQAQDAENTFDVNEDGADNSPPSMPAAANPVGSAADIPSLPALGRRRDGSFPTGPTPTLSVTRNNEGNLKLAWSTVVDNGEKEPAKFHLYCFMQNNSWRCVKIVNANGHDMSCIVKFPNQQLVGLFFALVPEDLDGRYGKFSNVVCPPI